jgi:hypothetical protein
MMRKNKKKHMTRGPGEVRQHRAGCHGYGTGRTGQHLRCGLAWRHHLTATLHTQNRPYPRRAAAPTGTIGDASSTHLGCRGRYAACLARFHYMLRAEKLLAAGATSRQGCLQPTTSWGVVRTHAKVGRHQVLLDLCTRHRRKEIAHTRIHQQSSGRVEQRANKRPAQRQSSISHAYMHIENVHTPGTTSAAPALRQ